jgi:acetyltransferase-like isoleucine patch superfamily enzyme
MRYINPQVRTGARALGFGGVASYAVLRGSAATVRTKNATPGFLVSVPNQAQPESYLTLASFAVRKNNSREVLIGGGFMSYSSGIHPDRVMAVIAEKADDQSRAQKGFSIYKITPKQPLAAGEYAIILYTGEVQVGANWFTGTGNSYFDFGVDR